MTSSTEVFDSVSEALTFTFANPREKIEHQVFVLPKGVPVFPLILLRADIQVNDIRHKGYFGAIDKQLTSDTEFICKGVNIFHVHKEIFTGFRDYRGRFPTSMQHACIIRLDTPVKMSTVPQVNNAIAIAFIADFDHLLVTNRVWMPMVRSTDE